MSKITVTPAQIIALRSAEQDEQGRYTLPLNTRTGTITALMDRGICLGLDKGKRDRHYLTVQGVSVMHSVSHADVIASKGYKTSVSDDADSLAMFVLPEREGAVTVQGEYVEAPDAFRHMAEQEAERIASDGGCVGLCAIGTGCGHCDEQYGPEVPQTDAETLTVDKLTPNGKATYAYYANNGMDDATALRKAADKCGTVQPPKVDALEALTGVRVPLAPACPAHKHEGWNAEGHACTILPNGKHVYLGLLRFTPQGDTRTGVAITILHNPESEVVLYMVNGGNAHPITIQRAFKGERVVFDDVDHAACPTDSLTGQCVHDNDTVTPDKFPTVCVVQERAGMSGMMHYHAPQCLDVRREMGRFGASLGHGAYAAEFSSVADIITHEYADVENGELDSMIMHANDDFDGLKIMPCLSIPNGELEGFDVVKINGEWKLTDKVRCVECGVHGDGSMTPRETERGHLCGYCAAQPESDAGFVETIDTMEYLLSVVVDETTGATVELGWVMLDMNRAQAHDYDRVAEEYGRVHGTGKPRNGWASIIRVHDVCAV
jgi:hypothetical protein